jgi:serine/threonine-protein kinase ULK4
MDKYHIYEEIGKGEFSQVYKGREKNTIVYVAIKRSEKSVMSLIVNEVQLLHKLSCPHIMRFFDWYETRNNIWLILEYCTGGDLESLIAQDKYLPEASVKMFGLDIVSGLKVCLLFIMLLILMNLIFVMVSCSMFTLLV